MTRYLLSHLLEESASSHPDRVAVVDGDRRTTYGDLKTSVDRLASVLVDVGVQRGDRVGLYLDKSLESIVGLHGVLRTGAAYVPLDPHAPVSRLGFIAADCGVRVLLTGREKEGRWPGLIERAPSIDTLVVLNQGEAAPQPSSGVRILTWSDVDAASPSSPAATAIDDDLAYILYTSGSTGVPKGVMLSHRNGLAFVEWAAEVLSLGPEDRLSNHAPLHFDLSIFDIFGAAASGASVSIVPSQAAMLPVEMARFIEERRITVWYSVPSALTLLVTRAGLKRGAFPELRAVVFAGEVFPTKYLRRLMDLLPHARFQNWYGPTETNVCTWYEVSPIPDDDAPPIPIGRAVDNTEAFVVSDDGRQASGGEEGELYVRGAGVMGGYWGRPDLTAERLVPDPRGYPGRAYRTGDMVVEGDDGDLRFLGRRDAQIKSRGYRIELGEIETALYGHPAVVECAVTAVPDDLVTNRIQAHVVVQSPISAGELLRFCAQRVPRYMVPETLELLETLPKTSTGKVDRQALIRR